MESIDRIEGGRRAAVFGRLRDERTVLQMRVLGQDYERLTIIIGVKNGENGPSFQIDCPQGFRERVHGAKPWRLHFEFTSSRGIHYLFRTLGGKISGPEIWIKFPEFIERRQRRKEFRLQAAVGTLMKIPLSSSAGLQATVINISLGGALLSWARDLQHTPLKEGYYLKNLVVNFSSKEESVVVKVGEAVVKRLEKDSTTRRYLCALQFTRMEADARKTLSACIYRSQRALLRKLKCMGD